MVRLTPARWSLKVRPSRCGDFSETWIGVRIRARVSSSARVGWIWGALVIVPSNIGAIRLIRALAHQAMPIFDNPLFLQEAKDTGDNIIERRVFSAL